MSDVRDKYIDEDYVCMTAYIVARNARRQKLPLIPGYTHARIHAHTRACIYATCMHACTVFFAHTHVYLVCVCVCACACVRACVRVCCVCISTSFILRCLFLLEVKTIINHVLSDFKTLKCISIKGKLL